MIAVAGLVNMSYLFTRSDPVFPLVYIWACSAIYTGHRKCLFEHSCSSGKCARLSVLCSSGGLDNYVFANDPVAAGAVFAGDDSVVSHAALAGIAAVACAEVVGAVVIVRRRREHVGGSTYTEGSQLLPS